MSDGSPKEPESQGTLAGTFGAEWLDQTKQDYKVLGRKPSTSAQVTQTENPTPRKPFWRRIIPSRSPA